MRVYISTARTKNTNTQESMTFDVFKTLDNLIILVNFFLDPQGKTKLLNVQKMNYIKDVSKQFFVFLKSLIA